jgi:glycosyltransferase involved in cell wall biosynthesis
MRIAHIIWGLETGGAETMLVDIINDQVKTESVALLVVNDLVNQSLSDAIDARCTVRFLKRKVGSKSLLPWIRLNLFLFKFKPDIIHFHLEGMRKMVFYSAPKVFTIHNMHTSGVEYTKYKQLYAISDAVRQRTKEQGFDSITIKNGLHTQDIAVKKALPETVLPYYHLVCVGRLYSPHKGQDILIKALVLLKAKGFTQFHLDIIGDGESRGELEKMINDSGLSHEISLLGKRDRKFVYSHLCDYDLFILPSRSEGFGLTVAEAMCAKVPVLTSDLDGPMEVIGKGAFGFSFRSGDIKDLADKIENVFNNGIQIDVNAARDYAIKNYDIEATSRQYLKCYRGLYENSIS